MKTPLQGSIALGPIHEDALIKLLQEPTRYHILTPNPPIKQHGRSYDFVVLRFDIMPDGTARQNGQAVLCDTQQEACSTAAQLSQMRKKHLGAIQAAGLGGVAWVTNLRRLVREILVRKAKPPRRRRLWLALERDIDQDTNEVTVIRRKEVRTEQEARRLAQQWQWEYEQEKKAAQASMAKSITPPPPPRTLPLTRHDLEDLAKAKITALKRQWPLCFAIFDKRKSDPASQITDQQVEDAYLLDLAEQGIDPKEHAPTIRADLHLISALHKAAARFKRRGKGTVMDLAAYLLAFNWDLGWCYLSDSSIAKKVTEITGSRFDATRIKNLRVRVLGLVAKHQPGPEPKSA